MPRMPAPDSWPAMSESTASVALGAVGGGQALRFYDSGGHHPENGTLLGFWLYLMSDCLVFTCLFAAYGVLGRNYAGGPSGADLFALPLVAVNTSLLLLSSITYGFAMIEMQRKRQGAMLTWLALTGLLGAGFIGIELHEFANPDPRRQRPTAQCLPVVVLYARRHPRSARDLRHRLAAYTDGAGRQARADRCESAAAHVSVDVLALPRRDLDRRLHLRLLDGSAAMSAKGRPEREYRSAKHGGVQ